MLNLFPFLTPFQADNGAQVAQTAMQGMRSIQDQNQFEARQAQQQAQFETQEQRANRQNQEQANQFNARLGFDQQAMEAAAVQQALMAAAADPTGKAAQLLPQLLALRGIQQEQPMVTPPGWQYLPPVMPASTRDPAAAAQEGQRLISEANQTVTTPPQAAVAEAQQPETAGAQPEGEDALLAELDKAQKARDARDSMPDEPSPGDLLPPVMPPGLTGMSVSMPIQQSATPTPKDVTPPPKGPGKMKFKSSVTGRGFEFDAPGLAATDQTQAKGAADALGSFVIPQAMQAAVNESLRQAIASGAVRTPEQVTDWFQKNVMPQLAQQAGMMRAESMARAQAQGRQGVGQDRDRNAFDAEVNRMAGQFNVKAIEGAEQAAGKLGDLLNSNNPLADRQAMAAQLKQAFSAVTSDKELAFMQQAGGLLNRVEQTLNNFIGSGELPADYKKMMTEASAVVRSAGQKERERFANTVIESFRDRPDFTNPIPRWESYIMRRFTGKGPKAGPPVKKARAISSPSGTPQGAPPAMGTPPAGTSFDDEAEKDLYGP